MDKKEPIQISSLSEFIEWVNQLGFEKYLFRGVPNKDYKIQASVYRRLKEDVRNSERFLQINKDLITEARLRGHGEKGGRELGDLEILAQLQHFGAATCLIDFTRNAQVALYFACERDPKWEKKSQDSENAPDGKVYAVRNDLLSFRKVIPDLLKEKIDYFLPRFQPYGRDPQLYFWEPGYQNNRIIAQQSIFIFGPYEFDENDACIIKESCKADILIALEKVSGIKQAMLFPDFDGFARLHREGESYKELSASDYFNRAMQASGEEAIANYGKAIELDSQNSDYYEWRASAKRQLGWNEEAIEDYNRMVEVNPSWYTYERRGKILFSLERYQQAIADFGKVIELNPDAPFGYTRRGRAKFELGQYQEAIADLDTALQIDSDDVHTYLSRGKAKEQIGDLEGAKEDFQKALTLDVHTYLSRGKAKEQIGDLEGAKEDFQKALTLEYQSRSATHVDEIKFDLQRIEKRIAERK